jgi:hypothetical protein
LKSANLNFEMENLKTREPRGAIQHLPPPTATLSYITCATSGMIQVEDEYFT